MAEAHGRLTGRPGICFVTRGPGATNASIGARTAFQDSTPMVLFVGDVARIPEYVARAFAIAMNGRPGPVVMVLPEAKLTQTLEPGPLTGLLPQVLSRVKKVEGHFGL
jgi:acetolactate synthase-1/2/3 large subunit